MGREQPRSEGPQFEGRVALGPLAPGAAERMVDGLRTQYGLGQAYRVRVRRTGRGQWDIEDGQGRHEVVSPMSAGGLEQWYWDRYGDVIAERRETSEG